MFEKIVPAGVAIGGALLWGLLIPLLQQQKPEWFSSPWALRFTTGVVLLCFVPLLIQMILGFYGLVYKSVGENLSMGLLLVLVVGAVLGMMLAGSGYYIFLRGKQRDIAQREQEKEKKTPPAPIAENPPKPTQDGNQPPPKPPSRKPSTPKKGGHAPAPVEPSALISSMIIEFRLTCEMKPGHQLEDGEDSGVLSEHDFTRLVGPSGKFPFPWVSPVRWWKQEDNRVVFVDRYALANTSDLIGRPISILSTFETLIVVPKMIRTGFVEKATFAEVSVRVNGQEYWQMSQKITRPEFPRFGFEIPVSILEEERMGRN